LPALAKSVSQGGRGAKQTGLGEDRCLFSVEAQLTCQDIFFRLALFWTMGWMSISS